MPRRTKQKEDQIQVRVITPKVMKGNRPITESRLQFLQSLTIIKQDLDNYIKASFKERKNKTENLLNRFELLTKQDNIHAAELADIHFALALLFTDKNHFVGAILNATKAKQLYQEIRSIEEALSNPQQSNIPWFLFFSIKLLLHCARRFDQKLLLEQLLQEYGVLFDLDGDSPDNYFNLFEYYLSFAVHYLDRLEERNDFSLNITVKYLREIGICLRECDVFESDNFIFPEFKINYDFFIYDILVYLTAINRGFSLAISLSKNKSLSINDRVTCCKEADIILKLAQNVLDFLNENAKAFKHIVDYKKIVSLKPEKKMLSEIRLALYQEIRSSEKNFIALMSADEKKKKHNKNSKNINNNNEVCIADSAIVDADANDQNIRSEQKQDEEKVNEINCKDELVSAHIVLAVLIITHDFKAAEAQLKIIDQLTVHQDTEAQLKFLLAHADFYNAQAKRDNEKINFVRCYKEAIPANEELEKSDLCHKKFEKAKEYCALANEKLLFFGQNSNKQLEEDLKRNITLTFEDINKSIKELNNKYIRYLKSMNALKNALAEVGLYGGNTNAEPSETSKAVDRTRSAHSRGKKLEEEMEKLNSSIKQTIYRNESQDKQQIGFFSENKNTQSTPTKTQTTQQIPVASADTNLVI